MKRKLLLFFGTIFTISSVKGLFDVVKTFELTSFLAVVIAMCLGVFMIIKGLNTSKTNDKDKKETYSFRSELKGTFLKERQLVLCSLYKNYYDKSVDGDEVVIYDNLKFIDENENTYDKDAIAVYTLQNEKVGYINRNLTSEFRSSINTHLKFKSYLTIYKDDNQYFADVQIVQRNVMSN